VIGLQAVWTFGLASKSDVGAGVNKADQCLYLALAFAVPDEGVEMLSSFVCENGGGVTSRLVIAGTVKRSANESVG